MDCNVVHRVWILLLHFKKPFKFSKLKLPTVKAKGYNITPIDETTRASRPATRVSKVQGTELKWKRHTKYCRLWDKSFVVEVLKSQQLSPPPPTSGMGSKLAGSRPYGDPTALLRVATCSQFRYCGEPLYIMIFRSTRQTAYKGLVKNYNADNRWWTNYFEIVAMGMMK